MILHSSNQCKICKEISSLFLNANNNRERKDSLQKPVLLVKLLIYRFTSFQSILSSVKGVPDFNNK